MSQCDILAGPVSNEMTWDILTGFKEPARISLTDKQNVLFAQTNPIEIVYSQKKSVSC